MDIAWALLVAVLRHTAQCGCISLSSSRQQVGLWAWLSFWVTGRSSHTTSIPIHSPLTTSVRMYDEQSNKRTDILHHHHPHAILPARRVSSFNNLAKCQLRHSISLSVIILLLSSSCCIPPNCIPYPVCLPPWDNPSMWQSSHLTGRINVFHQSFHNGTLTMHQSSRVSGSLALSLSLSLSLTHTVTLPTSNQDNKSYLKEQQQCVTFPAGEGPGCI